MGEGNPYDVQGQMLGRGKRSSIANQCILEGCLSRTGRDTGKGGWAKWGMATVTRLEAPTCVHGGGTFGAFWNVRSRSPQSLSQARRVGASGTLASSAAAPSSAFLGRRKQVLPFARTISHSTAPLQDPCRGESDDYGPTAQLTLWVRLDRDLTLEGRRLDTYK